MLRVARLLTALLAFTLLAANSASAITAASVEKTASGLFGAPEQRVGINALASSGRVDEKLSLLYDFASDFPVAARAVTNPVPRELARVVAGSRQIATLGRAGAEDVFVTAADDIAGMNAAQLSEALTIPASDTFTVIRFPTPTSGIASPVLRTNPGFLQGGLTRGGAREFVIPNGPIPPGATITVVGQ